MLLGLVLGIGYCMKAIMMPMGIVLLPILFFWLPRPSARSRGRLVASLSLAFLVMLLVAAPLIAALSRQAGSLSFGDAGRLNYLWHVNKLTPADIQQNAPAILSRSSPRRR